MRNITVRASLMAVLCLFTVMIVFGAGIGVFALYDANQETFAVQKDASSVNKISDMRLNIDHLQSRLREVELQKELQHVVPASLVDAATLQQQLSKQIEEIAQAAQSEKNTHILSVLESGQAFFTNMTEELHLFEGNQTVPAALLTQRDTLSTQFNENVTKYHTFMQDKAHNVKKSRETAFKIVLILVTIGMSGSLFIVWLVHCFLKQVVIRPLNEAIQLLNKVASGDLTTNITVKRNNEIGHLFSAMQRMQQSLYATVSRVRNSAESIHVSSQEIADGNVNLAHRTETQAGSLQDTAASIDELTGAVTQNADNAQQANALVQGTVDQAINGGEVVKQVVQTMNSINTSANKIVDIVDLIDDIAFQTNLLALNASVEAARAGEQGRGFAVVANEVHGLAQRSAAAAKEVNTLINVSLTEVKKGNALVGQAGTAMDEMVQSVCRVRDLVGEISLASKEQSIGITQVNGAISKIDDITHQNAGLVEKSSEAAQSLRELAETLIEAVSEFKIEEHALSVQEATFARDSYTTSASLTKSVQSAIPQLANRKKETID